MAHGSPSSGPKGPVGPGMHKPHAPKAAPAAGHGGHGAAPAGGPSATPKTKAEIAKAAASAVGRTGLKHPKTAIAAVALSTALLVSQAGKLWHAVADGDPAKGTISQIKVRKPGETAPPSRTGHEATEEHDDIVESAPDVIVKLNNEGQPYVVGHAEYEIQSYDKNGGRVTLKKDGAPVPGVFYVQ